MKEIKKILQGLLLIFLQLVAFNKIHLFGYATPLLYVMLITNMSLATPRWRTMLYGFCFGLMADITVNTPGISAASLTLIGFLHKPLLGMFLDKNSDKVDANIRDLGYIGYGVYSFVIVALFSVLFYSFSMFTFSHPMEWLWSVLGTMLITWVLVMLVGIISNR